MDTVIAVLVGLLTLLSVWFARRQVRLAQIESGGRTTAIAASASPLLQEDGRRECSVSVQSHGPGKLHALRIDVVNVGEDGLHSDRVETFSCDSEPVEWQVVLSDEQIEDAWVVVSWGATRSTPLGRIDFLSEAVRRRIQKPGEDCAAPIEVWKYKRPYWFWAAFENRRRWWMPGSGRHRQLGEYVLYRPNGRKLSQGPLADPTVADTDADE
ncbi:hypothetical protein [Gordonia sp. MP11Mi]|uniref:hypothetical protein n=1 Tax=Gordonia sp. MP11Mi TaxID=3022769 RepID=UPI003B21A3EA